MFSLSKQFVPWKMPDYPYRHVEDMQSPHRKALARWARVWFEQSGSTNGLLSVPSEGAHFAHGGENVFCYGLLGIGRELARECI